MANGASCDAAGFGGIAVEDLLSAVGDAAVEPGWAERPSFPLLGTSCVLAAAGAAIAAVIGARVLEFAARFGIRGAGSLLEMLFVLANPLSAALAVCAATVVAWGERVEAGAVWRAGAPAVAAGSAAVELTGLGPAGVTAELFLTEDGTAGIGVADVVIIGDGVGAGAEDAGATLAAGLLGAAGRGPWADPGAGCAGVKGAAATDGDSTIGDWPRAMWSRAMWSKEKTGAPVGTGVWNRLSVGVGAGETGTGGSDESDRVCVGQADASEMGPGETRSVGIGGTRSEAVKNGAGAAEVCVGRLGDKCASPEADSRMGDGSAEDFGPGSVGSPIGTGEFADAWAALESSGRAIAGISRVSAAGDTAEIGTAETAVGAG